MNTAREAPVRVMPPDTEIAVLGVSFHDNEVAA